MSEVKLYINGYEADLSEDFELRMNYTVEKTTNPTSVKNNYSKTITLPSTPNNNKIFNNLWNPSSIYNQYFDLIKKSDFKLFYNGDLFEEGYVKVDNIIKNGDNVEYKCTLYGGLGDFFYSLSVDKDGNKMKLSDLDYGGGAYEFDIMVNKDVIYEAWDRLTNNTTEGTIYDDINFAPCYNGIPENFSADKVIMNKAVEGPYSLPYSISVDDVGYRTLNGWILGELKEEYDEWSSRDIRSYLQRPVFRVKTLFRGICNPECNGGYTVDLDSSFFNQHNPYYEKAWITLPLISEMDEVTTITEGVEIEYDNTNIDFVRDEFKDVEVFPTITTEDDVSVLSVRYQLATTANLATTILQTGYKYTLNRKLMYYNAPIAIQFIGKKKDTNEIVYQSDIEVFTSYNDINTENYTGKKNGKTNINVGEFIKSGDTTTYIWGNNNQYRTIEIVIRGINNINNYDWSFIISRWETKSAEFNYWNPNTSYLDCVFIGLGSNENGNLNYEGVYEYNYFPYKAYATSFNFINGSEQTISEINKRKLTKSRLLGKDGTPLEYLLGYTKQFGLYFIKDVAEKKIYIMTRKTFYGKRNVINLENLIDRGETITITPLNFEKKWYDMGLKVEKSKYSELYDKVTDIPYGTKRVDTGYEYVKEKEDLLKDNIYKGGVMVREKSPYLVNFRLPK